MKKEIKNKTSNKKNDSIEINVKINKAKLLKGIGVVLVVIGVLGIAFFASKNSGNGKSFDFTNITIDQYLERMKYDEKSIIYVARPTCSYCVKETPIIKRLGAEYNLKIYYLNTQNFYSSTTQNYTEDGYKFINSAEQYKDGFGTPNTIIVQNGKIVDGIYQYVEANELKDLFVRNGFINE